MGENVVIDIEADLRVKTRDRIPALAVVNVI